MTSWPTGAQTENIQGRANRAIGAALVSPAKRIMNEYRQNEQAVPPRTTPASWLDQRKTPGYRSKALGASLWPPPDGLATVTTRDS
jgi:hypothetical protein